MKNDALLIFGAFLNPFTRKLREALNAKFNSPVPVKMRNGDWCEVIYLFEDEEGHPFERMHVPDGAFTSVDRMRYWHANGRSLTSRDFDLIEHRFDD